MRAAAPGAARRAGPPGQGIKAVKCGVALEPPAAGVGAGIEFGAGAGLACAGLELTQQQVLGAGLAGQLKLHRQATAVERTARQIGAEIKLRRHSLQPAGAQAQWAADIDRRRPAVEPQRLQGVELERQLGAFALPAALAADAPGIAALVGQLQTEALKHQAIGMTRLAAGHQRDAAQRQSATVPGTGLLIDQFGLHLGRLVQPARLQRDASGQRGERQLR